VLPRQRQLGVIGQVAWGLDANVNGAKLCYLDASVDGAKPRVYFLKSFRQRRIWENLSKKGLKSKKKDTHRN
jgi:hypothetical protein